VTRGQGHVYVVMGMEGQGVTNVFKGTTTTLSANHAIAAPSEVPVQFVMLQENAHAFRIFRGELVTNALQDTIYTRNASVSNFPSKWDLLSGLI